MCDRHNKIITKNIKNGVMNIFIYLIEKNKEVLEVFFLIIKKNFIKDFKFVRDAGVNFNLFLIK